MMHGQKNIKLHQKDRERQAEKQKWQIQKN